MKIEIGCGKSPREGYKSCDIRDIKGVDYVCSAEKLPFNNKSIDEIFSRHVIEHFTLEEFLNVLIEWNRVLKNGGKLYIICPNMIWHMKQIINGSHESLYNKERGKNDRYWGIGSIFGWQQNEYDLHKFGYYFELLKDILSDFGFENIEDFTENDNGIENAPWHLEVSAIKKTNVIDSSKSKFSTLLNVTH